MPKETISERKALEKALKESEQQFRDYLKAAADRYWETDENHMLVFASNMSPEANRFDTNTMIGKNRWEIDEVSPDAPHWQECRKFLNSHQPFKDFKYVIISRTLLHSISRTLNISSSNFCPKTSVKPKLQFIICNF